MFKACLVILTAILAIPFFGCGDKDDDSCHGCDIDLTEKEYEFKFLGRIQADCSGRRAANRTIELKSFYKEDSIVTTGQTDTLGYFSLSYTILLPGDYAFSSEWESYCLLHVVEDSVTFFLSGLADHTHLDLQVGDSLDIDFYVDHLNNPLRAGDSIFYRIEPGIMKLPYTFKVGGPLGDHALVHTIKDRWRFVELDDDDRPVFNYRVMVKRTGGSNNTYGYLPSGRKEQCVMSHLDLAMLLP